MVKNKVASYLLDENLVINMEKRQVLKNDIEIILPELSYRLLLCLAQHAPNVVSQQHLLEHVWQGKIVSDDTIKKRVSRLREAIKSGESFIVAERGMGYRLGVQVQEQGAETREDKPIRRLSLVGTYPWIFPTSILILTLLVIVFSNAWQSDEAIQTQSSINVGDVNSFDVSLFMELTDQQSLLNATVQLTKQLDKTPNDISVLSTLSASYLKLYQLYQPSANLLAMAETYARLAVEKHPKQPWGYVVLSDVLISQGQLVRAIQHADQAIALAASWVDAYVIKARALRKLGKIKEAWQTISSAKNIQPEDIKVLREHAQVLRFKNMFKRSERQLNALYEKDRKDVYTQFALAELHMATGFYEKADAMFAHLAKQFPASAKVKFYLAMSFDVQSKLEHAISLYKTVAQTDSDFNDIALMLVKLHENDLINTDVQTTNEATMGLFSDALSVLITQGETAFIEAMDQAISNGFATEYFLKSSILINALEQQSTINDFKQLALRLEQLNQNKRIKRIPVLTSLHLNK